MALADRANAVARGEESATEGGSYLHVRANRTPAVLGTFVKRCDPYPALVSCRSHTSIALLYIESFTVWPLSRHR